MKLKNYHLVFPRIPSLIIHKAALTTVEIHVTKQQSIYIHLTYSCILYCISLYKVCTRSLLSIVLSRAPSMQKWRPLEASFDSACGRLPAGGSIGFTALEASFDSGCGRSPVGGSIGFSVDSIIFYPWKLLSIPSSPKNTSVNTFRNFLPSTSSFLHLFSHFGYLASVSILHKCKHFYSTVFLCWKLQTWF
jgi:hypothetical protein